MGNNRIAVIGCGNLGSAIINGLIKDGVKPSELFATKRNIDQLKDLKSIGVTTSPSNMDAIEFADIIILGLKPYNILEVAEGIKDKIDPERHMIVSLATGITIEQLEDIFTKKVQIFRAMPNTAAEVGESMTCISSYTDNVESIEKVKSCFDSIGKSILINEPLMDAATVIGACGIAYVLRFMRSMTQGGIQIGFDAKTASEIVSQTVKGAAELLIKNESHPETEIDKVTTPKGCTIAGLNEMEHNGFSSALIKGITTSFEEIN